MLHLGRLGSEYARKGGKITKDYRSWFKKSADNMFWRIISFDRKNILSELQDSSITSLAYAKALRLPLRMKQNCEDDWENDQLSLASLYVLVSLSQIHQLTNKLHCKISRTSTQAYKVCTNRLQVKGRRGSGLCWLHRSVGKAACKVVEKDVNDVDIVPPVTLEAVQGWRRCACVTQASSGCLLPHGLFIRFLCSTYATLCLFNTIV